jgi:hypothetical protein
MNSGWLYYPDGLKPLADRIALLKRLEGAHDQTVRCTAIEVVYGAEAMRLNITATEVFRRDCLARLEGGKP